MYQNHIILISNQFLSKVVGMGDDLNLLQKTISNSKLHRKPILSIVIISPLFGLKDYEYPMAITRMIFMRKESQILHKNIEFLLINLVSNQYIFIKAGIITKVPIETFRDDPIINKIYQHALDFVDRNKHYIYIAEFFTGNEKKILENPNIMLNNINYESTGLIYFNFEHDFNNLIRKNKFYPYQVMVEEKFAYIKNDLVFARSSQPTNRSTLAEWPMPNYQLANDSDDMMLKLGFQKTMHEYYFLSTLIKDHNWSLIPYDKFPFARSLSFEETFEFVKNSKVVIGAEGGICHLARMFGTPFIMIIPKLVEINLNQGKNLIKNMFYHWDNKNFYADLPSSEIKIINSSYFIFEKDLESTDFLRLINSIENFFPDLTAPQIVFFTVDVDNWQSKNFVRKFCNAYHLKYGKDVEIHKPF